jgi:hypothetical protein
LGKLFSTKKITPHFMERVETLLQQLQQQFTNGASTGELLLTSQLLQQELMHLQQQQPLPPTTPVVVAMPFTVPAPQPAAVTQPIAAAPATEEKIIEVLKIDEAEVEAELEEIKRNAALMQHMSVKSKPQLLFDMAADDIPTLARQQPPAAKEVKDTMPAADTPSLNDILKTPVAELGTKLTDAPVKDLKKAIGVNDRYLFINELFRGDEAMYERSIKTINGFSIFPEAEYWIRRELKTKLGWTDTDSTVAHFDQLVKRRFS